jgi:hypothetical protein
MRHHNNMTSDGTSNLIYHLLRGCAASSAGPLVVERGQLPKVDFTFRAAKVTRNFGSTALPANSFNDNTGIQVWDDVICGFADSNSSGGISAEYYSVIRAELSMGVESTAIPEAASDTDNGGLCGHMNAPTDDYPRLTLEIKADEGILDDWESVVGSVHGVSKYLGLQQYGTADIPGTGVFAPEARLIEQPTFEPYGESFEKMTLVYRLYPAKYDGTAADSQGNQPFYIVGPADVA